MPVEERRRAALRQQVTATWGEEAAETLFELMTPAGHELATRQDVAVLQQSMDHRFAVMGERLEAMEHRIVGAVERRVADSVTLQTRTLVVSQLGAVVVIAGLGFGLR
jgi:hypothetical protein